MSVCDFLKDSKCVVTSSSDYIDCSDYVPADYGYDFRLNGTKIENARIDTTTGANLVFTTTTTTTSPTYLYTVVADQGSTIVDVPKREKVIKNIKVLKCRCCDAKLDSTKMYNNIIKCEYCDSDNYIELEDE